MIKKLLNPIANFDEKVLLGAGLAFVVINIALGEVFGFKMASVLKFTPSGLPLKDKALAAFKAFSVIIVAFYLLALVINKKTRFIDIANTFLIGVIPIMISTPITYLPFFKQALDTALKNPYSVEPSQISIILLFALINIPFGVYSVIIYYNGFKTATNMKHWYHIVMFAIALFIIPGLTQLLFLKYPFI